MENGYIDLHVHSNKSDGLDSVAKIINMALSNNVSVLALAEHYNISSYMLAKRIAGKAIEIIPAMELGTDMMKLGFTRRSRCHILVYYPEQKEMYKILNEYEEARDKYVQKVVTELNLSGIKITLEKIKLYARDKQSIGRYDVAQALNKLGIVGSIEEAYDKYLAYSNENSIEREKPTPIELIKKISKIGGVPVLAHPNSLAITHAHTQVSKEQDKKFNDFIIQLVDAGLKGIEAQNSFATPERVEYFKSIARKYDLIATAGSDYHGRKNDIICVGRGINNNMSVTDYTIIEKLKAAATKSGIII
ncbi:MAG: PHP domain-containing protein [Clostridia bacterium]